MNAILKTALVLALVSFCQFSGYPFAVVWTGDRSSEQSVQTSENTLPLNQDDKFSFFNPASSRDKAQLALVLTIIGLSSLLLVPVLGIIFPSLSLLWGITCLLAQAAGLFGFSIADSLIKRNRNSLSGKTLSQARWAKGLGWALVILNILSLIAVAIFLLFFFEFSFSF